MNSASEVRCLLRFGPRNFVEEFCYTGRLYMNTLNFFKTLEANDELRSDPSEGLISSHAASKTQLFVESQGNLLPIKNLIGQLKLSDKRDQEINVFSLYAITENIVDVDDRVFSFGDCVALIQNSYEFLQRLKKALENSDWDYRVGLVDYVDKDNYSGEMGAFRKYSGLEYQSEFRIVIHAKKNAPLTDLYLGDLRDITHLIDAQTVKRLPKELHKT
jgi:hypothetical protein